MNSRDYLNQHGWREHRTGSPPFKWGDPENRETRYSREDAFEEQVHREAVRLHVALAALELAQAALSSTLTFLEADEPTLTMSEQLNEKARVALAAVRGAREEKE